MSAIAPAPAATPEFDRRSWARIADAGLFRLVAAAEPSERIARIAGELEREARAGASPGLLFSVATHLASTVTAVHRFGAPALWADLRHGFESGALVGAHAITELNAGSDVAAMAARARVVADAVEIDAEKIFVTNGPIASHVVVYARSERDGEDRGVSAYLVPSATPGFEASPEAATRSLSGSPIGSISLRGCRIPDAYRLGREGAGMQVLDYVMKREIVYAFSADIGRMKRRIDDAVQFCNARRQFGAPIASFSSVASTVADMYVRVQGASALMSQVITRMATGADVTAEVAAVKIAVSEANLATAIDAVHLRGASGVGADSETARDVSDALAGPIYSGTNRIQRSRIAAMLGLRIDG